MNAAERLEAAITKLEELKRASVPGPWSMYALDWRLIVLGDPKDDDADIIADISRRGSDADAALIVTLHRTIDAQLSILRADLAFIESESGPLHEFEPSTAVLALADAILGDSDA